MRNFIIIEGPDGAGKSTLGRQMAESIDGVYFHCTCTKWLIPGIYDYMENVTENMLINVKAGRPIVMDRSWISEWVYGRAIGRGVDVSRIMRMHNMVVLHPSVDAAIVYAEQDDPGLLTSQDHGYTFAVAQRVLSEYADAMEYFDSPDSPVIPYNWKLLGHDIHTFTQHVLTYDWQ